MSAKALFRLLNKIWREEKIPDEWKKGLLVNLPKNRKNWRGVTLLLIASKINLKPDCTGSNEVSIRFTVEG